jgi:hypothetical protein
MLQFQRKYADKSLTAREESLKSAVAGIFAPIAKK